MLSGKKTYIVGIAAILSGIAGMVIAGSVTREVSRPCCRASACCPVGSDLSVLIAALAGGNTAAVSAVISITGDPGTSLSDSVWQVRTHRPR